MDGLRAKSTGYSWMEVDCVHARCRYVTSYLLWECTSLLLLRGSRSCDERQHSVPYQADAVDIQDSLLATGQEGEVDHISAWPEDTSGGVRRSEAAGELFASRAMILALQCT